MHPCVNIPAPMPVEGYRASQEMPSYLSDVTSGTNRTVISGDETRTFEQYDMQESCAAGSMELYAANRSPDVWDQKLMSIPPIAVACGMG